MGRSRAIAQMGRLHLSGFPAWMAWLLVHIFYLIGFKNRVVVMIVWAWSYFTYRRGSRLIILPDTPPPPPRLEPAKAITPRWAPTARPPRPQARL